MTRLIREIDPAKVEVSIKMINNYVTGTDVSAVIAVLEAIIKTPEDDSLLTKLSDSLQPLGIVQGSILTYAPYISVLISENLFDDD